MGEIEIFKNLTEEELERIEKWYRQLNDSEQKDVSGIITTLDEWIHGKIEGLDLETRKYNIDEPLETRRFFVLYAIGSTVTDNPNPSDVDLLMVTNYFINIQHSRCPNVAALIERLGQDHDLEVDEKISEDYAEAEGSRVKINLLAKKEKSKRVDLVFQYDVISEVRWTQNDKYPSETIFRFGTHDIGDELYYTGKRSGWENKPAIFYLKTQRTF